MDNYFKFLIIAPSWVGDMVMAQSLLIAIKQKYPEAIIDVLAPEWNQALLDRMPEVNQAINLPFSHGELNLLGRYKLAKKIKSHNYTHSFVLPNSFKSALVPFFANIPNRIGWVGECRYGILNKIKKLDKTKYPLMVQRFYGLLNSDLSFPKPKLKINKNNIKIILDKYNLNLEKPIIALSPGAAFGSAKRWPEKHYAELANEKIKNNYQIWLFGSNKDKKITDKINNLTNNSCINLAGQLQLFETIDLLSQCAALISNDSGLLHVGCALDIPVIGIYGSTTPDFTPPLGNKSKVLQKKLDCRPCFKRECPLEHLNCLNLITPKEVVDSLDGLLS